MEYRLVGREKDLQYMQDLWDKGETKIFGLYGIKTVGKSRVIMEFLGKLKGKYPKIRVETFDFRVIRTFNRFLKVFCGSFTVVPPKTNYDSDNEDEKEDEENECIENVKEKIKQACTDRETACVIFLNNLEDAMPKAKKDGSAPNSMEDSTWDRIWERIIEKVIRECNNTYIFITSTRYAKFSQYKPVKLMDLGPLDDDSSIELLREVVKDKDTSIKCDKEILKGIARLCFGLPMAVINAGHKLNQEIYKPKDVLILLASEPVEAISEEFLVATQRIDKSFNRNVSRLSKKDRENLVSLAFASEESQLENMDVKKITELFGFENEAQCKMRFIAKYRYNGLMDFIQKTQKVSCNPMMKKYLVIGMALKDLREDIKENIKRFILEKMEKIEPCREEHRILTNPTDDVEKPYSDNKIFFSEQINVPNQCLPAYSKGSESDDEKYIKTIVDKGLESDHDQESDENFYSQENNELISSTKRDDHSCNVAINNNLGYTTKHFPNKSLSDSALNNLDKSCNNLQTPTSSSERRIPERNLSSLKCRSFEENDQYPSKNNKTQNRHEVNESTYETSRLHTNLNTKTCDDHIPEHGTFHNGNIKNMTMHGNTQRSETPMEKTKSNPEEDYQQQKKKAGTYKVATIHPFGRKEFDNKKPIENFVHGNIEENATAREVQGKDLHETQVKTPASNSTEATIPIYGKECLLSDLESMSIRNRQNVINIPTEGSDQNLDSHNTRPNQDNVMLPKFSELLRNNSLDLNGSSLDPNSLLSEDSLKNSVAVNDTRSQSNTESSSFSFLTAPSTLFGQVKSMLSNFASANPRSSERQNNAEGGVQDI